MKTPRHSSLCAHLEGVIAAECLKGEDMMDLGAMFLHLIGLTIAMDMGGDKALVRESLRHAVKMLRESAIDCLDHPALIAIAVKP